MTDGRGGWMYGNKQSLAYLEALYKSLAIDYFCYGCLSSDFCKKKGQENESLLAQSMQKQRQMLPRRRQLFLRL